MSKIGKKPILVPKGIEVKINPSVSGQASISIKGPKGELKKDFNPMVSIKILDENIVVESGIDNGKESRANWGLARALIANMVKGVAEGFEKKLEFEGVGYKAAVKGSELELSLGYSHPILMKIPTGITVQVEKNTIKLSGIDKELIGHFAAEIKSKRPPEPYKGKGIKYAGEVLIRKAGKKAATAA